MLLGNYLYSSLALEAGSEHDVDFHCTDMPSMSFCSVWGYASTYLVSFIRETLLNVTSFQIPVYVPGEGGAVSQKCEAKDGGGFRSPLLHSPPLPSSPLGSRSPWAICKFYWESHGPASLPTADSGSGFLQPLFPLLSSGSHAAVTFSSILSVFIRL